MFDTFVLNSLIDELNKNILSYRLQRVLSPSQYSYILRFRRDKQLLISLDPSRCYAGMMGGEQKEVDSPTPFSTYLRRTLSNAKLLRIAQRAFDRVLELTFSASTPTMDRIELRLIIELMGRHSNMIVTDDEGRILQALKYTPHMSESQHIVRIGRLYEDLPSNREHPLESTLLSSQYKDVAGYTPKLMRLLPEEIKARPIDEISQWILAQEKFSMYIDEEGKPYDFHRFENPSLSFISFPTLSSLIEAYYQSLSRREHSSAYKRRFEQILNTRKDRIERKLQKQLQELDQAKDANQFKETADILLAALYSLPKRAASVEVYDFYREQLRVITLNEKYTVSQNAQLFYKNYEKAKRAKKIIESQLQKSRDEYDRLEQLRYDLSMASSVSDLQEIEEALISEAFLPKSTKKKPPQKSKPRRFEYQGATYLVGKNAVQNNEITFRSPRRDYLWFHAKDIPGSHVVLLQTEEETTEEQLFFGAQLAAYFSKDPQTRVQVDVTQLKHVRKQRGSALGRVTYTNQRSIIAEGKAEDILLLEKK